MERDEVGGEFFIRLISEVPIFSVVLQKPPVVYKHFICVKFKEFITGMLRKKTNFIFHQIWTWNLAKWRFMLLSELWDWSVLCHISIFFLFRCRQTISMYWVVILFSISDAVCSLSCTLINDVDFVSGRPGFQIPTPTFLGLMFVWTKKKVKIKLQQSTNGYEFNRI